MGATCPQPRGRTTAPPDATPVSAAYPGEVMGHCRMSRSGARTSPATAARLRRRPLKEREAD
eukprot:10642382-Alexandrium_andersonii.AAC.1